MRSTMQDYQLTLHNIFNRMEKIYPDHTVVTGGPRPSRYTYGEVCERIRRLSTALDRLGLDFAPSAMFIAVLALIIKDRTQLGVALGCGVLAVGFACAGFGPWGIILATVIAASGGLAWETWNKKLSS